MDTTRPNIKKLDHQAVSSMIFLSGFAALSWTVIWQILSSLALGVSAWGTALTLAVTMGGMCIGSLVAGKLVKKGAEQHAIRIYGLLELLIGTAGFCLTPAFILVEKIDTFVYAQIPEYASLAHILGIVFAVGIPAVCMGATTPIFGLIAKSNNTSIASLYGLNTIGAALGSLLTAFLLIPMLGVSHAIYAISLINIFVGIFAIVFGGSDPADISQDELQIHQNKKINIKHELLIVSVTGFSTLALEVVWFRSFTAAFLSTTAAFSIMVAAVLISLGVSARLVPILKNKDISLSYLMGWAGILILLATPLVERFDLFTKSNSVNPVLLFSNWFFLTLYVTGLPILCLGVALPWILDGQKSTRGWSNLYGVNTLASIFGSISAGWFLLPCLGVATTSWAIGLLVLTTALTMMRPKQIIIYSAMGVIAFTLAVLGESGVGKRRIQFRTDLKSQDIKIISVSNGPDATVSVAELKDVGERVLVIDGFVATGQSGEGKTRLLVNYMQWMGHLPMLLHANPKNALVICFGTGQTANAVRRENPLSLDIVDINENVYKMAQYFTKNEGVLSDPRVNAMVMDGRAYLRRTTKRFDIITLEPMPPTFAGVNALYSKEFYEMARTKLNKDGIIAQWVPFNLLSPYLSASISKTFQSVFPNAILWVDPDSLTGILLGSTSNKDDFGVDFPGFARNPITRILTEKQVKDSIYLNNSQLTKFSGYGDMITDDNQLLAYGNANLMSHGDMSKLPPENFQLMAEAKGKKIK